MLIGLCTAVANAAAAKAAGFDFVEENVQGLLHPHDQSATDWKGNQLTGAAPVPVLAANCLLPGDHKVTGPAADPARLARYIAVVVSRAQRCGIRTLVFGSGGARNVPDGFNRSAATAQIVTFLRSAAPVAADHGVTLVVEHLNRKECNILNTLTEAAEVVREVSHPAVRLLFDTHHFWLEGGTPQELRACLPLIHHVHLADRDGRTAPGLVTTPPDGRDYTALLRPLKASGYGGAVSVESAGFDIASKGNVVASFIRDAWHAA